MMDSNVRLIASLRENNDKLREENKALCRTHNIALQRMDQELNEYKRSHDFYMLIQNACRDSEVVRDEFQRFLMVCRLTQDEETPGLTSAASFDQSTPFTVAKLYSTQGEFDF